MDNIKFVIFDCDGVLVDSEYLVTEIEAELLTKAGYEISAEVLRERFAGLIFTQALMEIEREANIPFSATLIDEVAKQFHEQMQTRLSAIEGAREAVEAVKAARLPYCICSNSTTKELEAMLKVTNLYDLFEGKIYSAPDVGTKKPKPAPDIYLYAADKYQVEPRYIAVVEDSTHGVTAAHRAGMRVIGFTGGSHAYPGLAERLVDSGAETVIANHKSLKPTLEAMNQWRDI